MHTSNDIDNEIGDAKDPFFDNQENLAEGDFIRYPSSYKEISEELFSDGDVGKDPNEELDKMLGWPLELLHTSR